jgi:transcriptional regulator with XRE-family HTH domain
MELRGDKVKTLRMARNWTQQQLAEICDVNLRTVQRVENQGNASLETIMALCVAFEVKREVLFEVPKPEQDDLEQVNYARLPISTFVIGFMCGVGLSVAVTLTLLL